MNYTVAAFYKFIKLLKYQILREPLFDVLSRYQIKGTVLLASEGVNGTIAGQASELKRALAEIQKLLGITDLEVKYSEAQSPPFKRTKVRLKKEIVTIGNVTADPTERVGTYVEPSDWNNLIGQPDVVLIDTRNNYEFEIGTFNGALNPHTDRFSEFPQFVRQKLKESKRTKIAMFCTGGIRCEKASSFLLSEGFENVYHLKGGILKYLEMMPEAQSQWRGECFVFDERVAVRHGLQPGTHSMCHGCLMPVSPEDRKSPKYLDGVSCPACADRLSEKQKAASAERQKQHILALQRGDRHLGPQARPKR